MQEIKKRRIVIASVLKPVDDTRMFEKMGQTLALHHEVHIIGFQGNLNHPNPGIQQHSIGKFNRLSLERVIKPWQVLKIILRLSPDILIICTHELLVIALVAKVFTGCRLWYDVQENYFRNIRYTNAFPRIVRPFLAMFVRLKEILLSGFIERFILAESAYADEMPFVLKRNTVLENKYQPQKVSLPRIREKGENKRLLFSGTLSESTGLFIAIELASALYELDSEVSLTIAGYCPRRVDYEKLSQIAESKRFMRIIGGDSLIPHETILAEISKCGFGIISYPPNPSTQTAIPTKLYEYMANKLPIILIDNPVWVTFAAKYSAAIPFDHKQIRAISILEKMNSSIFYPIDPQNVYWETEAAKLLLLV
jgi:glycosyltransferase involved in cell wall biosynthesis